MRLADSARLVWQCAGSWTIGCGAASALVAVVSATGSAQEIRGIVRDAASPTPVVAAEVAVLRRDSVLERSITDAAGRFRLRVDGRGAYRLRVTRVGYVTFVSAPVTSSDDVAMEIELRPAPTPLDPIEATVERRIERLERVGFYTRLALGFGYFLTPEQLKDLAPLFPDDLFRSMNGVRLRSDGVLIRWPYYEECPVTVAVDGFRISEPWTEVVHVKDIEAVEVYPRSVGLPAWLTGTVGRCGALLIWTK